MTRTRLLRPTALTLAAGLLLAGCGSDTVEPKEWMADICGSASKAQANVQKAGGRFQADPADPAKTKASFLTLLSSIEKTIEKLEADVENAGVPDTDNGEKSKQRIIDGLQAAEETFAKARKDVQAVDSTNSAELLKVFGQVGQDITEGQQKFGRFEDRLQSPELKKAYQNVPACQNLRA